MSDKELSYRQLRAVVVILASKNLLEAAQVCRLTTRTLRRYMAQPAFKAALSQAQTNMIIETERRLLSGQANALDVLEDIMTHTLKDTDRRQAATAWIDFALKLRELSNDENRLARLEEFFREQNHPAIY